MHHNRIFNFSVRVPYAHVDQMGFVYYSHYFVYFEMARASLLREVGLPYTDMEKRGVMLPVVEAHCDYKKAAHFDDLLEVRTKCSGIRGTRIRLEYEVKRNDEILVTGHTVHICMSPEGKVLRPLPELHRLINPHIA